MEPVLANLNHKKQTRRGRGGSKKCSEKSLKIIGNNVAGLMGKKDSFLNLVNKLKPGISMLQETKLYRKGQIKLDNYSVFENIRGQSEGGGLLTMVHENFEPMLIPRTKSSKMEENFLVVEAKLGKSKVRYLNAYGVQENASSSDKMEFYSILDEEVENAFNNNCLVCVQLDANGKLGNEIINGDPNEISPNGRLLLDLINRKSLVVVNSTDKCNGIITRMKVKAQSTERSVLDYFIVCQEFYSLVISLLVDEERTHILTRFYKRNGVVRVVESDHNLLVLNVSCPWEGKVKKERIEIFNLRNKKYQKDFFNVTNETNVLSQSLENRNVMSGGKQWLKSLKTLIHQNFKKIRLTNKDSTNKIQELLSKRKDISNDKQITEEICLRNKKMIIEQIGEMSDTCGKMTRIKMWKIRQKVCPKKNSIIPVAKQDEDGNLVCNRGQLKELYVRVYKDRLRHRTVRPEYRQMKEHKEYLFNLRLKLSKSRKSADWEQSHIMKVFKNLKINKATDPVGLVSELFKPGVAGADVLSSVLTLCNMIKDECRIPEFMQFTNITSIWKQKGSRLDLNNDRGVFTVTCLRAIVDKLTYNDWYETIDGNMSDSNVGGRHNRSIRDNLFIVYGIINNALNNNLDVDLSLYDIAKCFDAQWHAETMNDLWDVGVTDDKFAVISEMNTTCNISVRTPVGMTERFILNDIEMQGTVMGPIKASVQLDTLGRDCYERQEGLYWYNGCVAVPPLEMIDDVASFALCSPQSIVTNAIVNAKIESKKLELGPTKCVNLHIGNKEVSCDGLKVHDNKIVKKDHETYLGDVICSSGTNSKNIETRSNRGIGAVSSIMSTLNQVSLGHFYFEIALIFRDSLLVSKLVYSSEIWYNITNENYTKLEEIDEMYLRKIFCLPKSAPRLGLYVECGKTPLRHIIRTRRLLFYWHILHLDENELLAKFFLAQKLKPSRNDWVLQIFKDLEEIELSLTEIEIKNMSKNMFKKIILEKVNISVKKSFMRTQKRQSKTSNLKISENFKPSSYLFSKRLNVPEIQTLFKLRTRCIEVKGNQKSSYKDNMLCKTCSTAEETQQHVFECEQIRNKLGYVDFSGLNYEMIFGRVEDQEKFTKVYHVVLKARDDILNTVVSTPDT